MSIAATKLRRTARATSQDGLPFFHHFDVVPADCMGHTIAYISQIGCHIRLPVHIVRNVTSSFQGMPAVIDHALCIFYSRQGMTIGVLE